MRILKLSILLAALLGAVGLAAAQGFNGGRFNCGGPPGGGGSATCTPTYTGGGSTSTAGGNTIFTFLGTGSISCTGTVSSNILVVGGGAGGAAGGGGAGGY